MFTSQHTSPKFACLTLSVFRTNEIGEGLRLLVGGMVIMAVSVVSMGILLRANIVHLQDVTALWASLDRAVSGHLLPIHQFCSLTSTRNFAKHTVSQMVL